MRYEAAITEAGGQVPVRGPVWKDANLFIWNAPTGSSVCLPLSKVEGKSHQEVLAAILHRQAEHAREFYKAA